MIRKICIALFLNMTTNSVHAQNTREDILFLFDVDGTLTVPRQHIEKDMKHFLTELRKKYTVGIVGGSDLSKQREQLGDDLLDEFDYIFSENGLVAYENGKKIGEYSIKDKVSEKDLNQFISFCLKYIGNLDLEVKRGTFIEFRNGMINISPVGRNCNREERLEFAKLDQKYEIRKKMIDELKKNFAHLNLKYSIGGQISIDVFPQGFDKTFALRYLQNKNYKKIYFFGDNTNEGGNDYEIFKHPDTLGFSTKNPEDTKNQVSQIVSKLSVVDKNRSLSSNQNHSM